MKKIVFIVLFIAATMSLQAQSKNQAAVELSVKNLIAAMISGDRSGLEAVASDHLSYGHSGGHVEGKTEFVEKIASGQSDFVTLEVSEQTIDIVGNTAIVRHHLNGTTNDGGKPAVIKLNILYVFKKENGSWKMLARQAVKA